MQRGQIFFASSILLGALLGYLNPYAALDLNASIYFLLFLIMLVTALRFNFNYNFIKDISKNLLFSNLFFFFLFFPTLMWLLSELLLNNPTLKIGIFLASLAPIAIVAPDLLKKDQETSYNLMLFSILLSPIHVFFMTWLFNLDRHSWSIFSYSKDLYFICLLPVLIAEFLKKYKLFNSWLNQSINLKKIGSGLNLICIGLIAFVLFGLLQIKTNINTLTNQDIIGLSLLAIFQDFGSYYIYKFLFFTKDLNLEKTRAFQLSLTIRNVAFMAAVLLNYDPMLSIAAGCVLVVHSVFITWVLWSSAAEKFHLTSN